MGLGKWFTGEWIRERIENSAEYRDAVEFAEKYRPSRSSGLKWVLEYSLKEFDSAVERIDTIDSKADSLIGYLGAGSGLVSLASLYMQSELKSEALAAYIPALFFMLVALVLAVVARIPAKIPTRPEVRTAIECAEMEGGCPELEFSSRVGVSCKALSLAAGEKARLVRRSYWMFAAAILWLVGFVLVRQGAPLLRKLISWVLGE